MNTEHLSKAEENKMSVLLKFYIQKVFTKIKSPKKVKEMTHPPRRNRDCRE